MTQASKKQHLVSCLALLLVLGFSGCTREMMFDYPAYETLGEAVTTADHVVIAEFVSDRTGLDYPVVMPEDVPGVASPELVDPADVFSEEEAIPTTYSRVRIINSLKGDLDVGVEIEVKQEGDNTWVEPNTTKLGDANHDVFVLFMDSFDNGEYCLINPEIGALKLLDDGRVTAISQRAQESFDEWEIATLTEIEQATGLNRGRGPQ
jgi:hypothetical protein